MRHDYSALVTLALRYPTKQSMKMVVSTQRKPFICEREHYVQRIDIRTMSLTSVMELHKKRPQHKVLAAIEESKYNPMDSRSGKVDWTALKWFQSLAGARRCSADPGDPWSVRVVCRAAAWAAGSRF